MELEEIKSFAIKNREAIKGVLTKRDKANVEEFISLFGERLISDFMKDNFDEIIEFIFTSKLDNYKNKNSHLLKLCAIRLLDNVCEYIDSIAALKAQTAKKERPEELQETDLFFFAVPYFRMKPYLTREISC